MSNNNNRRAADDADERAAKKRRMDLWVELNASRKQLERARLEEKKKNAQNSLHEEEEESLGGFLQRVKDERLRDVKWRESLAIYVTFEKLPLATAYNIEMWNNAMPIFARNYPHSKKVEFIVTSFQTLLRVMLEIIPVTEWHFYEQLNAIGPCHGYVDIEIIRACNQLGHNKEEDKQDKPYLRSRKELECGLILKWMDEVREYMLEQGYIQDKKAGVEFLIFHASNKDKISFHIHIMVAGRKFENNLHVGAFMRCLFVHLQRKHGLDPAKNPFYIRVEDEKVKNKGDRSNFEALIDFAVYTRNRNFRMLNQTKPDKYRPLLYLTEEELIKQAGTLGDSQCTPEETKRRFDRKLFMRSILQRTTEDDIEGSTTHIRCKDPVYPNREPTSTSDIWYFRLDPLKPLKRDNKHVHSQSQPQQQQSQRQPKIRDNKGQGALFKAIGDEVAKYWIHNHDPSMPSVDAMKMSFDGYKEYEGRTHFVYFTARSKFCLQKNGTHQGNHSKFRVNLDRMVFQQSCHDSGILCHGVWSTHITFAEDNLLLRSQVQRFLNTSSDQGGAAAPDMYVQILIDEAKRWLLQAFDEK